MALRRLVMISFGIRESYIALCEETERAKSTLIKILSSMYAPTKGEMVIGEKSYKKLLPGEARELGIQTIYQGTMLA